MVVYWIANPVLSMRASVPKKDYAESDHAFYLSAVSILPCNPMFNQTEFIGFFAN
jgi:hypothetical protein